MPIELYQMAPSAPCRMVKLLASYLDIELEHKDLDLTKGEHLAPEFIKINPLHTVPTIVDDGLIVTESRAILMYFANKYGRDKEELYPTDPDKRAVVDMRICFDMTMLYPRFGHAFYPVTLQKMPLDAEMVEKLDEALGYIEMFLKDSEGGYIAGPDLTLADFSISVILSTVDACGHDLSGFPEIQGYLERCAGEIKGWQESNAEGAELFGQWFKASLAEAEG